MRVRGFSYNGQHEMCGQLLWGIVALGSTTTALCGGLGDMVKDQLHEGRGAGRRTTRWLSMRWKHRRSDVHMLLLYHEA